MLVMYSAAALPSRWRAAPAKNRIWSTIGPISSPRCTEYGLPVFSHSRCMISSPRASIASAIRMSASDRSDGVVSRQPSNAAAAACIAASTSAGPDSAASAYCSPVDGSITALVRPSFASTHAPLTKFLNAFMGAGVADRRRPRASRGDSDGACLGDDTQHQLEIQVRDTGVRRSHATREALGALALDDDRVVGRPVTCTAKTAASRRTMPLPERSIWSPAARLTSTPARTVRPSAAPSTRTAHPSIDPVAHEPAHPVGCRGRRKVHRANQIPPADSGVAFRSPRIRSQRRPALGSGSSGELPGIAVAQQVNRL